jgi:hypothetical protein
LLNDLARAIRRWTGKNHWIFGGNCDIRCGGTFERRTVSGRINPELENALIQAGYGQGISGETPGSIQLRRTQTFSVSDPVASSFRLHVGNAGTRYHTDSLCGCYPDNVKRELSICEICRNSSTAFEIGQSIFVL